MAAVRLDIARIRQVNLALGIIEYFNGRNSAAMKYFDIADQTDPLVMHYTAQVNKMAGETEVAQKIETRLDNWKASSLNLALARAVRLLDITELYEE